MASKKFKIGIVGLGIMGRGMAGNFLKKSYKIFVWNRTKTVAKDFEKKGAVICKTPAEVAENADIIFEITANDESSKSVWLGKNGILAGASKGKILITSATLSIDWTDQLVKVCAKRKIDFLDIPLTGGRIGAETGNLTLLCGGNISTLKKITPTLKAVAGSIYHFGPEGHGMRYKLILNFVQATHIIAFGQAMRIAQKNGMDIKKVGEALAFRPGGVITEIANKSYFQDPDPVTFSIEWITKDLTYAKQFAEGVDVTVLDNVLAEYKKAMKKGLANKDWMRVSKLT
jgi:3-hydroxyisobutyrate dehydrogenase